MYIKGLKKQKISDENYFWKIDNEAVAFFEVVFELGVKVGIHVLLYWIKLPFKPLHMVEL